MDHEHGDGHPHGHPENPGPAHHIKYVPPDPSDQHPTWYSKPELHYGAVPVHQIAVVVAPYQVHDTECEVVLEGWSIGFVMGVKPELMPEMEIEPEQIDDDGLFRIMYPIPRDQVAEIVASLLNGLPWPIVSEIIKGAAGAHLERDKQAAMRVVEEIANQPAEMQLPPSPEGLAFMEARGRRSLGELGGNEGDGGAR